MSRREPLIRFGVSMPEDLIGRFDEMIEEQGYGQSLRSDP